MPPQVPTMKLYIPANRGAGADGPVTERQIVDKGDGFTFIFTIPFRPEDIFRELMSDKQLGVDHESIKMKITHPGSIESARLRKELGGATDDQIQSHLQKLSVGNTTVKYEVGCQRTVYFPDGEVVSELIDLVENERIQWKQIKSNRKVNMIGTDDKLPVTTIALDAHPSGGTSVRMTYDFLSIVQEDGVALEGEMMQKLLATATSGWKKDMADRGYTPLEDAPTDSPSNVVRSGARMKADLDEEAAMKAAMLAKAAEPKKGLFG